MICLFSITFKMKIQGQLLIISKIQQLHNKITESFLCTHMFNPLCIDTHTLYALFDCSFYCRISMGCEKCFDFCSLLVTCKLLTE